MPSRLDLPPSRIHKYCKRRGLTLEQVLDACAAVGIGDAHRHRGLNLTDVAKLDLHFFPAPAGKKPKAQRVKRSRGRRR